jgi:hypothetical protein
MTMAWPTKVCGDIRPESVEFRPAADLLSNLDNRDNSLSARRAARRRPRTHSSSYTARARSPSKLDAPFQALRFGVSCRF